LQKPLPIVRPFQPNDRYISSFPPQLSAHLPVVGTGTLPRPVIATARRETRSPFECRINRTTASRAIIYRPASCLRRYCRLGRRVAEKIMEPGKRVVEMGHR
jgi:hypothetical protein